MHPLLRASVPQLTFATPEGAPAAVTRLPGAQGAHDRSHTALDQLPGQRRQAFLEERSLRALWNERLDAPANDVRAAFRTACRALRDAQGEPAPGPVSTRPEGRISCPSQPR
jgi:hypothetical protein